MAAETIITASPRATLIMAILITGAEKLPGPPFIKRRAINRSVFIQLQKYFFIRFKWLPAMGSLKSPLKITGACRFQENFHYYCTVFVRVKIIYSLQTSASLCV